MAAAMAAYNSATAIHEVSSDSTHHAQAAGVPVIEEPPAAGPSMNESLETAPVRLAPEVEPIESSTPVAAPVALQPDSGIAAVPAAESLVETVASHGALSASVEAAIPEAVAAAGAATGADHQTIAQAVHKVMERLKPELVEEIVRELKAKK